MTTAKKPPNIYLLRKMITEPRPIGEIWENYPNALERAALESCEGLLLLAEEVGKFLRSRPDIVCPALHQAFRRVSE